MFRTLRRGFLYRNKEDVIAKSQATKEGEKFVKRFLVRGDGLGFSLQHETFPKGKPVVQEYRNHVQAVMVLQGAGEIRVQDKVKKDKSRTYHLAPGIVFAVDAQEHHTITAFSDELHTVSVFNPPLAGEEKPNKEGVLPAVDSDGQAHYGYDHKLAKRLFEPPHSLKGGSSDMKDDPLF